MTPCQLYALRKRSLEKMRREELLVGILAATSANFSFFRPDEPLTAESFMIHPFPEPDDADKPVTGEDMMAAFANFPKG